MSHSTVAPREFVLEPSDIYLTSPLAQAASGNFTVNTFGGGTVNCSYIFNFQKKKLLGMPFMEVTANCSFQVRGDSISNIVADYNVGFDLDTLSIGSTTDMSFILIDNANTVPPPANGFGTNSKDAYLRIINGALKFNLRNTAAIGTNLETFKFLTSFSYLSPA